MNTLNVSLKELTRFINSHTLQDLEYLFHHYEMFNDVDQFADAFWSAISSVL